MSKEQLQRAPSEFQIVEKRVDNLTIGSLVIQKPKERKTLILKEALDGLPVASPLNLSGLSHLLKEGETPDSLRGKVLSALSKEEQFERSFGSKKAFLNNELLSDILSPDLRRALTRLAIKERYPVAIHEIGHAAAATSIGGKVDVVSVVPASDGSLGRTFVHGDFSLMASIAVAYGGYVAEELMGIRDHRGIGGDMSYVSYLASSYGLPKEAIGQAQKIAATAVRSFGPKKIAEQARYLSERGILL